MATYYTSSNNQRDTAPMIYLREPLSGSYPEAPVLSGNTMMYINPGPYSDAFAANSQPQTNCMEIQSVEASDSNPQQHEIFSNLSGSRVGDDDFSSWRDGRSEMLFMHPVGSPSRVIHPGHNLQGQGLSLSLSTHIPSAIQMASFQYRNPNMGFTSFLSPNASLAAEGGSRNGSYRDEQSRNLECLQQPGFHGVNVGNQDSNRGDLSACGLPGIARTIPNSKYLKAAQQLLDEVVNVRKALKQPGEGKNQSAADTQMKASRECDEASKNMPSNNQESTSNSNRELSHAERQELQSKLTKLLSMLDEVDRRYKQYYHQMQIVVSSFDVIAGPGAAKPYTALALQTISRHFRCLRDAINGQIEATRKNLGEHDSFDNGKGVGITRLRYVDQQLRQQKALQQLGMMQQNAWRPQRGLPESSVSILRAWLFEHFLHPYPKDSDKIMLARQTGLTRSQVSNWFINARVRLWKPMVEEMYKEEFTEMDSNSSSENNATKGTRGDGKSCDDRVEDLQQSGSSIATERCSSGQWLESKSTNMADVEMGGPNIGSSFHNNLHGESESEYGLLQQRQRQGDETSNLPGVFAQSSDKFMAVAAAAYQMSELGRFGSGSNVSLTLGLQHCEGATLAMSRGSHDNSLFGMSMRGDGDDDMYHHHHQHHHHHHTSATSTVVGDETAAEFECINPGSRQQQRFGSHLLHDFVS